MIETCTEYCNGCGVSFDEAEASIVVDGGRWHHPCWEPHRAAYDERCKIAYARPDEPRTWGVKLLQVGEDLWWRDWGRGYTINAAEAGLFSERFARAKDEESRRGGDRSDVAVPPDKMRAMFERARDSAIERLSHFEPTEELPP